MLANFGWLVTGHLAGAARPGGWGDGGLLEEDLDFLQQEGIRAIASLTEEELPEQALQNRGLRYLHLPVRDMEAPSLGEIIRFIEFVEEAEAESGPVLVHCGAGLGRTGTMLACYLVRQGREPGEAVHEVRQLRPGSVETVDQEIAVHEYASHLRRRGERGNDSRQGALN